MSLGGTCLDLCPANNAMQFHFFTKMDLHTLSKRKISSLDCRILPYIFNIQLSIWLYYIDTNKIDFANVHGPELWWDSMMLIAICRLWLLFKLHQLLLRFAKCFQVPPWTKTRSALTLEPLDTNNKADPLTITELQRKFTARTSVRGSFQTNPHLLSGSTVSVRGWPDLDLWTSWPFAGDQCAMRNATCWRRRKREVKRLGGWKSCWFIIVEIIHKI